MKKMILTVMAGLIMGLGCLIAPAQAAVPQVIPYQGQLTDAAGTPVNGVVNITFNLYTTADPTGGGWIWGETHTGVNVSKGLIKVDLGSVTGFPVGAFSTPVYLGVTVGGDGEMTQRTALTSTPFALHADDADTVGGFTSSQLDQSAHVAATNNPHGVTAAQVGAEVAGAAAAVQAALNTHAGDAAAHHTRYTNTEAVAAVGPHTPPTTSVDGLAGGTISSGVSVSGAVSATSFSGDGSGLTNVPGIPHQGAVYRWNVFDTYNNNGGWFAMNNPAMFGGVPPSTWTDGNALASSMSADKEVLRTLFTRKGYGGANALVYADQFLQYSSTNGKVVTVLFRIRNTTASPIAWAPDFYYTSYGGWNEFASVALNGVNKWSTGASCSGGSQCNYTGLSLSIPTGRTSTVIFVVPSGFPTAISSFHSRATLLVFFNNSLLLPAGLEYVDDLDTATGGWTQ